MFEKLNREELVAMLNKVREVLNDVRSCEELERICGNLTEAWAYGVCVDKLEEALGMG